MAAGVAKAAGAACAGGKVADEVKRRTDDRLDEHLRDALAEGDGVGTAAAVPERDFQLALVVAVDEADEVAEDDAVFVPQS